MSAKGEILGHAVVITAIGEYTPDDLEAAVASVIGSAAFQRGAVLVYDVRGTALNPSWTTILSRAEWIATLQNRGFAQRCAIVVPAEDHHYGLGRMLSINLDNRGWTAEVFTSLDDALLWAGIHGRRENDAKGTGA